MTKPINDYARLEKMRRDFIANLSHELRTPLTVLRGYLETLIAMTGESSTALDPKSLSPILDQMFQQSSRMEHLVQDLLLLSHLETESPEDDSRESVDVATMLKEICQDAKALSGDKGHTIQFEADPGLQLLGNEKELHSAFNNLVVNAIKYTPEKGSVTAKWFFDEANGQACFSVSDTGMGIEAKHIPRLTERFYRVDKARSRETGGTGLGLAIVKHVLMRHDGELTIESEPGQGSTFSCRFGRVRIS